MKKVLMDCVNSNKTRIKDVDNKLAATDNYVSRYLPFNMFCQAIECCKIIQKNLNADRDLRDRIENYEKFKMSSLYDIILADDGRAPKMFKKD